jgi:hypothetical protein
LGRGTTEEDSSNTEEAAAVWPDAEHVAKAIKAVEEPVLVVRCVSVVVGLRSIGEISVKQYIVIGLFSFNAVLRMILSVFDKEVTDPSHASAFVDAAALVTSCWA